LPGVAHEHAGLCLLGGVHAGDELTDAVGKDVMRRVGELMDEVANGGEVARGLVGGAE